MIGCEVKGEFVPTTNQLNVLVPILGVRYGKHLVWVKVSNEVTEWGMMCTQLTLSKHALRIGLIRMRSSLYHLRKRKVRANEVTSSLATDVGRMASFEGTFLGMPTSDLVELLFLFVAVREEEDGSVFDALGSLATDTGSNACLEGEGATTELAFLGVSTSILSPVGLGLVELLFFVEAWREADDGMVVDFLELLCDLSFGSLVVFFTCSCSSLGLGRIVSGGVEGLGRDVVAAGAWMDPALASI